MPLGPFKLVTVNKVPERAMRLIGRTVKELEEKYTIIHAANCATIEEVAPTVTEIKPDLLFCASMWTPEESQEIVAIAKKIVPDLKTHCIPYGLQVQNGPDAIVAHLVETIPKLLE
ncbi:hypothetical protein V1511DRAFT_503915 [Dipodascopsis uninucleata]